MTGRESFSKYSKIIALCQKVFSLLGKGNNLILLKSFRHTNGKFGLLLRYVFLKNLAETVGDNVSIQPGVYLLNLTNLRIGNNVSIHPMCYIDAEGGITIGNDVSIAHSTSILSTNHEWSDLSLPIKYNAVKYNAVVINDDVWIACGVRILAGVEIGNRSVVAAGAVVNKSFNCNTVVGGVPAKILKLL